MSSFTLYSRLGYDFSSQLKSLCFNSILGNVKNNHFDYAFWELGKNYVLPLNNSTSVSCAIFYLVYIDIWRPFLISIIKDTTYFVIFVDDFSRFTWIYFMKNHTQLPEIMQPLLLLSKLNFLVSLKNFK